MRTSHLKGFSFCALYLRNSSIAVTNAVSDTSFVVRGLEPAAVFERLQSCAHLNDYALGGRPRAAKGASDVTDLPPVNPGALRCFMCENKVPLFGVVRGLWETTTERHGKFMRTNVSLVFFAWSGVDKEFCTMFPHVRYTSEFTLTPDAESGGTLVRHEVVKFENLSSYPVISEEWCNAEDAAMEARWSVGPKHKKQAVEHRTLEELAMPPPPPPQQRLPNSADMYAPEVSGAMSAISAGFHTCAQFTSSVTTDMSASMNEQASTLGSTSAEVLQRSIQLLPGFDSSEGAAERNR